MAPELTPAEGSEVARVFSSMVPPGTSKSQAAIAFITAHPGMPLELVGEAVYPELDAEERARKITTLVGGLALKGKLKRVARGRYAVAPPKTSKRRALSSLKLELQVYELRELTDGAPCVLFTSRDKKSGGGGLIPVVWPPGSALPEVGDRWTFEARAKR